MTWDAQKVIITTANQRIVPPKLNSTLPKGDSKVNLTPNTVDVNKKFKLQYPNQKQSLESQFEQLPILVET